METLNRSPVDIGFLKFFLFRYACGSFTDDVKIADHGINRARVSAELVKAHAAGVISDLAARLLHVGDKQCPLTARHLQGCSV